MEEDAEIHYGRRRRRRGRRRRAAVADHFSSMHKDCEGHVFEGLTGYVAINDGPGLEALYRCLRGNDHFDSTRSDCEAAAGARNEGILGYIWKQANEIADDALYRCYFSDSNNHMTSNSPTCQGWR